MQDSPPGTACPVRVSESATGQALEYMRHTAHGAEPSAPYCAYPITAALCPWLTGRADRSPCSRIYPQAPENYTTAGDCCDAPRPLAGVPGLFQTVGQGRRADASRRYRTVPVRELGAPIHHVREAFTVPQAWAAIAGSYRISHHEGEGHLRHGVAGGRGRVRQLHAT